MAVDTLTLSLTGELTLAQHATATLNLQKLVAALTRQVSPRSKINWLLDNLTVGSSVTTARGELLAGKNPFAIETIVTAFESVGDALERRTLIPYGRSVSDPAHAIVRLLNGRVSSVRFETPNRDITILSESTQARTLNVVASYDAVEGRVQTVTNRKSLRFILYESMSDHPVSCYLGEGTEETMRDLWGRKVLVAGWVNRDPLSGLPATVRRITDVEVLPETPEGAYRSARGIVIRQQGQPLAETIVRAIRDA